MKIVFFLFISVFIVAQDFNRDEMLLQKKYSDYISRQEILDSLKTNLELTYQQIDVEKQKQNKEDKLENLLALALEKSKIVSKNEKDLKVLKNEINQLRSNLYVAYSNSLNSLQNKLSSDLTSSEKANIESKIKTTQSKKLSVSPLLPLFSFDPNLLKTISFNNNQDPSEKNIFYDYLKNALYEIDSSMTVIEKKKQEMNEILKIEQKTNSFINEIEDVYAYNDPLVSVQLKESDNNIAFNNNDPRAISDFNRNAKNTTSIDITVFQVQNILNILNNENYTANYNQLTDTLSTDTYLLLLDEGFRFLQKFRSEIIEKIKESE